MPRTKQFDVDSVLTKAMTAFWKRGYQPTSMQDLVECMGIGRGSIYDTFGGKRSLFVRSLLHYVRRSQTERQALFARSASPAQAILSLFDATIAAVVHGGSRDGCLLTNTALELSPHDPEVAEIVARAFAETEESFRAAIERGMAAGEISGDVDPQRTARSLLCLYIGLRVLVRSRPEESLLRSIESQAKALLH